jgi:hypothetical protein
MTGMATLATTGNGCNVVNTYMGKSNSCKGRKIADSMTIRTIILCRDMIGLLVYGPNRNIIGIAIMAALTIVNDTRVSEVQRRFERICGGVADDAVLGCR